MRVSALLLVVLVCTAVVALEKEKDADETDDTTKDTSAKDQGLKPNACVLPQQGTQQDEWLKENLPENIDVGGGTVDAVCTDASGKVTGVTVDGMQYKVGPGGSLSIGDDGVSGTAISVNGKDYLEVQGATFNEDGSIRRADVVEIDGPDGGGDSSGDDAENPDGYDTMWEEYWDDEEFQSYLDENGLAEDDINGDLTAGDATDVAVSEDGVTIGDAGVVEQGGVTVTGTYGVTAGQGGISGAHADMIRMGRSTVLNADDFSVADGRLRFSRATAVQVGCANGALTTGELRGATIMTKGAITIATNTSQEVAVRDCGGTELKLGLNEQGTATFAKDGLSLGMRNATATLTGAGLTVEEVAQTRGTAVLHLDRITKQVSSVDMNPLFSYEMRTGDPAKDFIFTASGGPQSLHIRREGSAEKAPSCTACAVVDIPGRTIGISGTMTYGKRLVTAEGVDLGYAPLFHAGNPEARVVMALSRSFDVVDDLLIVSDAPPAFTTVSNYLRVEETRMQDRTHRMAGVDATLQGPLARSRVRNYRTAYSNATMTIDDNNLRYQRDGLVVEILSRDNPRGPSLLQSLMAASLLVIILPRKGQLSVFVLLGLVALVAIAFMFSISATRLPVADAGGVQSYASACVGVAAKEALVKVGAQGGMDAAPVALWLDGTARLVPAVRVESLLSAEATTRTRACIEGMRGAFRGVGGIKTDATTTLVIGEEDVVVRSTGQGTVALADGSVVPLPDTALRMPNDLSQTLSLATTAVQSEEAQGMIDLDALDGRATLVFFPRKDTLTGLVRDDPYAEKGDPYWFAFGMRR